MHLQAVPNMLNAFDCAAKRRWLFLWATWAIAIETKVATKVAYAWVWCRNFVYTGSTEKARDITPSHDTCYYSNAIFKVFAWLFPWMWVAESPRVQHRRYANGVPPVDRDWKPEKILSGAALSAKTLERLYSKSFVSRSSTENVYMQSEFNNSIVYINYFTLESSLHRCN